jgi:putative ABC transport system ATP-binding protein
VIGAGEADVNICSLTKVFGAGVSRITAVDDVNLDITGGSAVAVTGPSGSGKSTLLHLIAAILPADVGTVLVGGVDITSLTRRRLADYRRRIGLVFQQFHLLPALTVLDNVVAPLLPVRTAFDKKKRALELLDAVGLADRHLAVPAQLSGGQQQRVAIARALIGRPRLVLADEPTGNLDSETGATIINLLLDLRRTYGTTLIIATHEARITDRCERVISLVDGRLADDRRSGFSHASR